MMRAAVMLLKAIRFDHTIFALPFALIAAFVASYGWPRGRTLVWIFVAMVAARLAALTFDRIANLRFVRGTARTADHAPAGNPQVSLITVKFPPPVPLTRERKYLPLMVMSANPSLSKSVTIAPPQLALLAATAMVSAFRVK